MSYAKGVVLALGVYVMVGQGGKALKQAEWAMADPVDAAVDCLARTIWGEARGEGYEGMQAVANVIVNRANIGGWWGNSVQEVCLKPWQFSCWNFHDPNLPLLVAVNAAIDPTFGVALDIAAQAVAGALPDITNGATHYAVRGIERAWMNGATVAADIGAHRFYKGVA